jgi:hypothetical protein
MEDDNQFLDGQNDIENDGDSYFIPDGQIDNKPRTSKREKALSIAVVIAIFFGIVMMYLSLAGMGTVDWGGTGDSVAPELSEEDAEAVELQNKDSDNDGLSDYDEINIYLTSPYLEDSDSDGQTDFEEIEDGTDPNCVGVSCTGQGAGPSNSSVDNQSSIDDSVSDLDFDSVMDLQQLTGGQIRALLIEQGVPEEMISQLSDNDLKDMFMRQLDSELSPQ